MPTKRQTWARKRFSLLGQISHMIGLLNYIEKSGGIKEFFGATYEISKARAHLTAAYKKVEEVKTYDQHLEQKKERI